tara:strand:+ start:2841 stop:3089 length:249 start_codon:yes stop_codon:yes gene_type:complete
MEGYESCYSESKNNNKNKNQVDDEEDTDNKIDLLQVDITNENVALNVLIGFVGLAQSRGCFAINESSKIYEAIKIFQNNEIY